MRLVLLILLSSFAIPHSPARSASRSDAGGSFSAKPNVFIIQTDEHNFRTLGCYRKLLPPPTRPRSAREPKEKGN
jgi:hypothetical protein